jgi:hypothetical protein
LCNINHDKTHDSIILKYLLKDNNLNENLDKLKANINNLKDYIENLNKKFEEILKD